MAQSPTTRESLLLINAGSFNQLGPISRTPSMWVGNYFLRTDWSTVDRFRGIQAAYIAANSIDAAQASPVNFSRTNEATPIIATAGVPTFFGAESSGRRKEVVDYLLVPDNSAWNAANVAGTEDMLRKWVQDPGVNQGDPYYSNFLETGMPWYSGVPIPGVFNRQGPGGSFVDHTFVYLKPSEDIDQRLTGGLEITIESVYNFYLDTMPAYEQVTRKVPEPVLPNFYIFETELRNTGSQAYSPDYYQALTLYTQYISEVQLNDWFVHDHDAGGYTETTSKSYYQAYVSSLQTIKNSESGYAKLAGYYNMYQKNVAVLHSDIDAIYRTSRPQSEGTSGLSFLPFYNIVTVGNDEYRAVAQGVGDGQGLPLAQGSFFGSLFGVENFDAASFIDILQLYLIRFLEQGHYTSTGQDIVLTPGTPGEGNLSHTYTALFGGETIGSLFHVFERAPTRTQTLMTASISFDLSHRDAGVGKMGWVNPDYDGFERNALFLAERIANNGSNMIQWSNDGFSVDAGIGIQDGKWERDNVVLIRDYSNDLDPPNPDPSAVGDFYDKIQTGDIRPPMRNFENVLMNQGAFSETVLYKIDKRVVDSAGNILPNIVQTIYLSPKFTDPGPLQYIDSQVRYGVRYQYDIKQVRVVFGNQYNYDDLQVYTAGYAGYGRAVGNALGFYEPTTPGPGAVSYVNSGLIAYTALNEDTTEKPVQRGYFVVAPTAISEEDWITMAEGSDYGSPKLDRVNLIFKTGWGFGGNETGGAVGGPVD